MSEIFRKKYKLSEMGGRFQIILEFIETNDSYK